MYKYLFLTFGLLMSFQDLSAQAGAKIYGGIITGYSRDQNITPDGTLHNGYIAGIDGRLNNDRMYFLIGANYGAIDLLSSKSVSYFSGDKLTFFKARVGLGFDIIKITPKFFVTSKLLGTMQFINSYDSSLLMEPYLTINDGTAGLIGGAGIRIGLLSVDLEYEYGLFNQFNMQKETIFDYISLTAGINF